MVTDTAALQMATYSKMSKTLYRRCGWLLNGGGSGVQAHPEFFQDPDAVTLCGKLFQSMTVQGKEFCKPHWWFSLGITCVLHGFYCLHFVGYSPSSPPLTDGQFCLLSRRVPSQIFLHASQIARSSHHVIIHRTWQPSCGFVPSSVCWIEW